MTDKLELVRCRADRIHEMVQRSLGNNPRAFDLPAQEGLTRQRHTGRHERTVSLLDLLDT